MSLKRTKLNHDDTNCPMSVDDKILSSDINNLVQSNTASTAYSYHISTCGSVLFTSPSNSPSDIFAYLRHNRFDAFRRSLDVHYNDIIQMRNEHGQTVLQVLVIHAYPYLWVRLLMMRGCDTCAQDSDGYTAAHYAVERDDVEMLRALTIRFHTQVRPISEERMNEIHEQSLKALTLKENQGLTVFMLACQRESVKCLNYLIELNLNDSHAEDQFGDTCLHYAVARRNSILVETLINTCKADVNGGNPVRPSVLDISQYNGAQQKPSERVNDDAIEQILLSHDAKSRCSIRRVTGKRKGPMDNDESVVSNLACLSIDLTSNGPTETARSHARMAASLQNRGDIKGAEQSYEQAILHTSNDTLDWATYAYHLAEIQIVNGQRQSALELLEKAIRIRKDLERNSQEIEQIQQAINRIQSSTS